MGMRVWTSQILKSKIGKMPYIEIWEGQGKNFTKYFLNKLVYLKFLLNFNCKELIIGLLSVRAIVLSKIKKEIQKWHRDKLTSSSISLFLISIIWGYKISQYIITLKSFRFLFLPVWNLSARNRADAFNWRIIRRNKSSYFQLHKNWKKRKKRLHIRSVQAFCSRVMSSCPCPPESEMENKQKQRRRDSYMDRRVHYIIRYKAVSKVLAIPE